MKVLLVDDMRAMVAALKNAIVGFRSDINVLTATTRLEVDQALDQNPDIDYVFLDLKMPGLSHYELLDLAVARLSKADVWVLSGSRSASESEAVRMHGATGYIEKSASMEMFDEVFDILSRPSKTGDFRP